MDNYVSRHLDNWLKNVSGLDATEQTTAEADIRRYISKHPYMLGRGWPTILKLAREDYKKLGEKL